MGSEEERGREMKRPPHNHPLTDIALKAFAESGQDPRSLIEYLSGVSPTSPPALMNAYLRVAKDVIENLVDRGLIYHGDDTWYYLVKAAKKEATR
jgi:hypothetical protein